MGMIKGKDPFCLFFVLIPALLGSCDHSGAQTDSAAYNTMLRELLNGDVPTISVKKAQKHKDDHVFLDARSKAEHRTSHIKGGKWVGYEGFDSSRLKGLDLSKDDSIVVYCSVGKRSETVTRKLRKAGYKGAVNLYGGIFEWVNQKNPVYDQGSKTDSVHAYSPEWGVWLNKGRKVYEAP